MKGNLHKYSDVHSHSLSAATRGDTVVSISPGTPMEEGGVYSVGIHPWDTSSPVTLTMLKNLVKAARDSRTVAVGECGIDRLRGGDTALQQQIFEFHARLAERTGKPLIIHNVRADDLIAASMRRISPSQEWIIHGFRGKPERLKALLKTGFSFSLGPDAPEELTKLIPPERLYRETD